MRNVENVEKQNGGVGNRCTTRLSNDSRMRNIVFIQRLLDGFHHVDTIFLDRVVTAVPTGATGAVIVDGKATAEIHKAEGRTLTHQLNVVATGFKHTRPNTTDIGDL